MGQACGRGQSIIGEELANGPLVLKHPCVAEKNKHVQGDKGPRHIGCLAGWVVVTDREHVIQLGMVGQERQAPLQLKQVKCGLRTVS